jgi:hypothetical protein
VLSEDHTELRGRGGVLGGFFQEVKPKPPRIGGEQEETAAPPGAEMEDHLVGRGLIDLRHLTVDQVPAKLGHYGGHDDAVERHGFSVALQG